MSEEARVWVKKHSPYKGALYTIHYMMADLANDTFGYQLWCGDEYLANNCRVSTKTVQRAREAMVADGLLEVVDPSAHRGKSPVYRFLMPEKVDTVSTFDGVKVDILSSKGGHPVQNSDPTPITRTKRNRTSVVYTPEFDELWENYPRQEAKSVAYRNYLTTIRSGIDHATLLAATVEFARRMREESRERRHILMASTFFGPNERWRDFTPAPAWVPTAAQLAYAKIWEDYETTGQWWDAAEERWDYTNPYGRIPMPVHPDGGLFDSIGRRYRKDPTSGERIYDPPIGA